MGEKEKKKEVSEDYNNVLKEQQSYAKKGFSGANEAVKMLEKTVLEESKELQKEIDRLKNSSMRGGDVQESLLEQLSNIKMNYTILPEKMRDDINKLSKSKFTITVFGRTMAGKSTLMEVLTHGNGASIGDGAQRTTRDVREYKYKSLSVVDVPGVAAFEGKEDEEEAFNAAKKADLIFFIVNDEDIQASVANCLGRIVSLGKPIICLINVRADLGNSEITPLSMKMFKRDLQKKMKKEHLEGIKKQLFEYGKSFGQEWMNVKFVYVHLKAAFLSQQREYEEYADELYNLSRFESVEKMIDYEISNKGGYYKFKAFSEIVTVPFVDAVETLFAQSAQNGQMGKVVLSRRRELTKWIKGFRNRADIQIETFLTNVSSELQKEVVSFSEDNYDNEEAGNEWNKIVKNKKIDKKAKKLLNKLRQECENEVQEIARETEFEIKFSYNTKTDKSLNMESVIDIKRVVNWTTTILSGGLTIVSLFVAPPLALAGLAVGLVGWLVSSLFDDYESEVKDARLKLENNLIKNINNMEEKLRISMKNTLYDELIDNYMRPFEATMNDVINSLFELSKIQHGFADKLNIKLKEMNSLVVNEALEYEGYEALTHRLARIPGYATMIVIEEGEIFSRDARRKLSNLLKERVWLVDDNGNIYHLIRKGIGSGCEYGDISLETINDNLHIIHITSLDSVDEYTRTRIRMVQQLTGFLVTE